MSPRASADLIARLEAQRRAEERDKERVNFNRWMNEVSKDMLRIEAEQVNRFMRDMLITGTGVIKVGLPPEPQRTPEETKEAFAALLAASGVKKTLPLVERVQHEIQLGELEDVKAKRAADAAKLPPDTPPPKILCPICHDPRCPWSD